MPFYAKTLGDNHAKQVDKELRASHAGETGAVRRFALRRTMQAHFCVSHPPFKRYKSV